MPITQAPSPFIGVIMLDTRFFRPAGDIGQPLTFERAGIPARFHRVARATARRVVLCTSHDLLQPFMEAAQTLEQQGAALITTSCGFLARYQSELQAAVKVPVISSSLLQCQHLERPGIVTFDAASLKADVLEGAGVPPGTPVCGLQPGCLLQTAILQDWPSMDLQQTCADVVEASLRLLKLHPDVEQIVLECTNMPPYREAIMRATGRQVLDLETMLLQQWTQMLHQHG
ncbi:MAG: aspartate/glutamate racemase family protein [Limnohabitans sp.]